MPCHAVPRRALPCPAVPGRGCVHSTCAHPACASPAAALQAVPHRAVPGRPQDWGCWQPCVNPQHPSIIPPAPAHLAEVPGQTLLPEPRYHLGDRGWLGGSGDQGSSGSPRRAMSLPTAWFSQQVAPALASACPQELLYHRAAEPRPRRMCHAGRSQAAGRDAGCEHWQMLSPTAPLWH